MVHSCDTSRVRARVCARARESGIVARLSTRQKRSKPTRGRRRIPTEAERAVAAPGRRTACAGGAPSSQSVTPSDHTSTAKPSYSRPSRCACAHVEDPDSQNVRRNHIITEEGTV